MDQSSEPGSDLWSVFDELATLNTRAPLDRSLILGRKPDLEACLRRVLRPHDEAGFRSPADDWMILLRSRLDDALDELTLGEISIQLGLSTGTAEPPGNLSILFASEAFLRYVNAYLYFGIRFLANRSAYRPAPQGKPVGDRNIRSLPLPTPPPLSGYPKAEEHFKTFAGHKQAEFAKNETALRFLDDFHPPQARPILYELQEPSAFELWLRGLRPETEEPQASRFGEISVGLADWVISRSNFYLTLQSEEPALISQDGAVEARATEIKGLEERPPAGWLVTNPIAARLALADIYWIARLLRADVSEDGSVTYQKYSWVHLLRFHSLLHGDEDKARDLQKAEDAIRSVFGYVCELVQNAVELARDQDRGKTAPLSANQAQNWRTVFDEELEEINRQRRVRHFSDPSLPPEGPTPLDPAAASNRVAAGAAGWSSRIIGAEQPLNLIGLAFSGGGIRSATFNLGVLQGLQELDLLRHVDYLSTVSGGGYIGSWLVANVRRSTHWLGRLTDWSESVDHLRAYSNYLAPRTGILSADTWNLGTSWLRNAILIQLTGLAWLFVLLLATLLGMEGFLLLGPAPLGSYSWAALVAFITGLLLTATVFRNLTAIRLGTAAKSHTSSSVRLLAVFPAWVGAYALSSRFWANAPANCNSWANLAHLTNYSSLLLAAYRPLAPLLGCAALAFAIISAYTLTRNKFNALWISPLCTSVLYLELVAIFLAFRTWSPLTYSSELAFVLGPSFVLLAFSACVVLLIGFTGRDTSDELREWWTRLGTWLAIVSGAGLFISGVAVFGPSLILWLFHSGVSSYPKTIKSIKWASVLSWLGTVIAGLFAGKSSKTSGENEAGSATGLELLARLGGFLFIAGSFLLGSTLLYVLLFEVFAREDSVVTTSCYQVLEELSRQQIPIAFVLALVIGLLFSYFFDINIFGLNEFYRNRLVRCYLGASRWAPGLRNPNPFTKFDFEDDLDLSRFRTAGPTPGPTADMDQQEDADFPYRGPLPLVNCTLNLGGSSDLALNTRHSSSFTLTPLRCGCDRPEVGYAPTCSTNGSFAGGVMLGQAVSISGAAVSSNMGYNTSPLVAFLLTMFNVRLGWWFPNPGKAAWDSTGLKSSLYYLVMELLGIADDKRLFLNTSDGGHFENLGIYELVRRRCRLIIACDAECDEYLQFGGLGNVIRICETDFGATIHIDVKSIRPQKDGPSLAHCAIGEIKYSSGDIGHLIYLKASMTGDEDTSIAQYRSSHPSFPHETTADQFFSEDQFESYRKLGLHVVRASFKGNLPGDDPLLIPEKMADVLTPAACASEAFLRNSGSLEKMWEKFRATPALLPFMKELSTLSSQKAPATPLSDAELCIGLELIQLMEEVFLDLRLDDYWDHPDNRGWAILFMRWARSPRLRIIWAQTRRTYGIRFEYFCAARLGLPRDQPIVRV